VRKRLGLKVSLCQILQVLSLTLFEKTAILCVLQAIKPGVNFAENVNQLILFDFLTGQQSARSFELPIGTP
jgi:hypothetical protein